MVSVAKFNDKEVAIKVFFDEKEGRARDIIESVEMLGKKNFSFVVGASYFKDELEIISPDTFKSHFSDVVIIDNIFPSIFDYIDMEDDGDDDIVAEYVRCVSEIIYKRILFDKISANDFCYNSVGEVMVSTISNIIYNPIAATDKNFRAFVNFLTGVLLKLIINERIAEDGEGEILYPENNRVFDVRAVDYFLSGEYCDWLLEMMTIVEAHCDIKCEALRSSLSSFVTSDIVSAFSSCLVVGSSPRTIREIDGYDIIGNSLEDRIAIVSKENGLIGYMDFAYHVVIDCIYQEATDFAEGIAVCVKNERYGVINRYGETILPFDYDKIVWRSEKNEFIITKGDDTYTKDRFSITSL